MGNPTTSAVVHGLQTGREAQDLTVQRFTPLQSEPLWNGCGQPTAIHACVLVKHRARQILTAIRTLDNRLRLFSWRVNADGVVLCTGNTDVLVNEVTQVDLVRAQKYVSACRTVDGALHLQCWDVSNTGAIYTSGSAAVVHDALEWLQLLVLAPDRLLTIGLSQDGRWHLSTWAIGDEGAPQQLYQESLAAVTGSLSATLLPRDALAAVTTGFGAPQPLTDSAAQRITFATVMHSAPDQLQWTRWHCLPNGELQIEEQVEQHHPTIVEVALTTVNSVLVTLLHSAKGRLQLFHGWPAPIKEQPAKERQTVAVTLAEGVRLFTVTNDGEQLMIAHVTTRSQQTGKMTETDNFPEVTTVEMHRWQPTTQHWQSCGSGTLPIATATELALCNQPLDGNAPFLTAIGTAAGALHLVTWGDSHAGDSHAGDSHAGNGYAT